MSNPSAEESLLLFAFPSRSHGTAVCTVVGGMFTNQLDKEKKKVLPSLDHNHDLILQ